MASQQKDGVESPVPTAPGQARSQESDSEGSTPDRTALSCPVLSIQLFLNSDRSLMHPFLFSPFLLLKCCCDQAPGTWDTRIVSFLPSETTVQGLGCQNPSSAPRPEAGQRRGMVTLHTAGDSHPECSCLIPHQSAQAHTPVSHTKVVKGAAP